MARRVNSHVAKSGGRLLFLVSNRDPRGGRYSLIKFAEALAERGHEVTLAATRYPIYFGDHSSKLKVKIRHQIPFLLRGCGFLDRLWSRAYDLSVLSCFIRKERLDYIVGLQKEDAVRAVRLGEKHRIPVANFVFETPNWMERIWRSFEGNRRFKETWEEFRRSLLASDKIIANSELTKIETEKWLGRKVNGVVHPGIDRTLADSIPEQKTRYQAIYLGAVEERKNIHEAIVALSKLDRRPSLVVCGEGELKQPLKKLARQLSVECQFRGAVSDYQKWVEIKRSLFMVFPTSFEGFGMPPAEALYCKIPCIASDLPILRNIYQNKLEYFAPHNTQELAEKMRFLLSRPEYRKSRGEEGHKYVRERLSWEMSAKEIEKCVGL